jgi:ZIP family zinc transporter
MDHLIGILIPFVGTSLGAALVLFLKNEIPTAVEKTLLGFASGVMVAASIWSLLLPSIERAGKLGRLAFFPAAVGFSLGICGLLWMDRRMDGYLKAAKDGQISRKGIPNRRTLMLILSVTLHNIPEGLAVGVAFAGAHSKTGAVALAEAFLLSVGIAIQNIPEGAIISLPMKYAGCSKRKSFGYGTLSGAVEPVAAAVTFLLARQVEALLPYLLAFAAGAMFFVVIEELIPEAQRGREKNPGTYGFLMGFLVMMILDVALG